MLRTMKAAFVAALMVAAAGNQAAAQDQEAGDIRVDLPARKAAPREEPHVRTRNDVGTVGPLRIYGGFSLAVGGELKTDDYYRGADLDPTVGLQFGADYVVHKYFSIGGETRFLWFKVDGVGDRDFLWDLDVKPRGRYVFHNLPLEVYGTMPLGLTVAGIKGPQEGGPGFNIGLFAGANWWFTHNIGINAEMGWTFHKFRVDFDGPLGGSVSTHSKMNQFLLLCPNFVYAL